MAPQMRTANKRQEDKERMIEEEGFRREEEAKRRKSKTKRVPNEKFANKCILREGEMALCCPVCKHLNCFTETSLAKFGIGLPDLKFVKGIDYVDSNWDMVPARFKKVKAHKAMTVHFKKKHPNHRLPPILCLATKEMKEKPAAEKKRHS